MIWKDYVLSSGRTSSCMQCQNRIEGTGGGRQERNFPLECANVYGRGRSFSIESEAIADASLTTSQRIPALSVKFHINVVAAVNLDCKLDLKTIAPHARNAECNPKVAPNLFFCVLLIFVSGKIVLTGAKEIYDAFECIYPMLQTFFGLCSRGCIFDGGCGIGHLTFLGKVLSSLMPLFKCNKSKHFTVWKKIDTGFPQRCKQGSNSSFSCVSGPCFPLLLLQSQRLLLGTFRVLPLFEKHEQVP
ncbi:hypothetical protein BC830DRAFT_756578 [Chytriomyces sp. MP71]|nr:hypothetical protein BC830DRAFT_756578 [Chytriomyces sp. MP71]